MKKFLAVFAVLAITVVSSVAFADVTVSGSVDIRNLATNNTADQNSKASDENRTTQERVRINVDAKNDNVKGRVTIENDWDAWGRLESPQANGQNVPATAGGGRLALREAWIDFTIPGAGPAHVKVGHQFLQLGNGWFFRSQKYGSDAWLVGLPGKNTVAFVDVKLAEYLTANNDDVDALVLLDNYKLSDAQTVGVYFARVADRNGKFLASKFSPQTSFVAGMEEEANIDTIGLWFNGKVGPVNLQAELDIQSGTSKVPGNPDTKFKGQQVVVQANVPMDALSVNATIAQGSGVDQGSSSNDFKQIVTALDADPHYTFVYEYFAPTACIGSFKLDAAGNPAPVYAKNTGFCNTTALNLGASYAISKNLSVSLDYWMLTATEKVSINGGTLSDDVGSEVDVKVNWKLYDNLTWNWQLGRLMPGKAYDRGTTAADDVDAVQGVLSYKF